MTPSTYFLSGHPEDPKDTFTYGMSSFFWENVYLTSHGTPDPDGGYELELRYTIEGFLWPSWVGMAQWGEPESSIVTIPGCYSAFLIRKVDEDGNPVQGATFTLTPDGPYGVAASATTDDDGYAVFEPGDIFTGPSGNDSYFFILEETGTPAGFEPNPSQWRVQVVSFKNGDAINFLYGAPDAGPGELKYVTIADPIEITNQRIPEPPPPPPTPRSGGSARLTPPPRADLAITATVDDPAPQEGQPVTFSFTVTNEGHSDAQDVTVVIELADGLAYVGHSASHGSFAPGTGQWIIDTIDDGEAATLQITAVASPGTAGQQLAATATVEASSPQDPNGDNNSASAAVTPQAPPPPPEPEPEPAVEEEPDVEEAPEPEPEDPVLPVTGGSYAGYFITGALALAAGLHMRRRLRAGQ